MGTDMAQTEVESIPSNFEKENADAQRSAVCFLSRKRKGRSRFMIELAGGVAPRMQIALMLCHVQAHVRPKHFFVFI
jgi:hypothetical protein